MSEQDEDVGMACAGAQYQFFFSQDTQRYTAPEGSDLELEKRPNGTYSLTFKRTGEVWDFGIAGYVDVMTDRHGNTITFSYATSEYWRRATTMTDSRGQVTTFNYSANGEDHLVSTTDPVGREYSVTYNSAVEIDTFTDPDGKLTSYTYGPGHTLTGIEDAEGNHTIFTYDTDQRVISMTRVDDLVNMTGPTWTYDYTTPWQTVVTDPNTHSTTYEFDRQGRIEKVTDPLGRSRSTTWRAGAQVENFTDLAGAQTINSYSTGAIANLESVKLPTGAETSFAYTDPDNLYSPSTVTSPQEHHTTITYDALGRPETVTDSSTACSGAGCTQTITYNADGSIDTLTDPNGHVTDYGYNAVGDLTTIDYPTPRATVTIGYDTIGRPTTVTDGNNVTTTYSYDYADRPTGINTPTDPDVTIGYDNSGNRTTRIDATGTTITSYDPLNRIEGEDLVACPIVDLRSSGQVEPDGVGRS